MMRFNPLLAALDTNHDGLISADEIRNAASALKALDKDGDGQLTGEEMRPRRPDGGGRGDRREGGPGGGGQSPDDMVNTLMAFDKNLDGKLSKDELPERMQGLFDRADANHDGFLTPEEIRTVAAAQASRGAGGGRPGGGGRGEGGPQGRGGPRANPIMTALDTNGDGVLSADEIRNAPASLKKLDKNGDGQLTMDELLPPRPAREDHE